MNDWLKLYRWLLAHGQLFSLNQHLYKLSLRGIGVLNSEGPDITGERALWRWLQQRQVDIQVVVDVGANTGEFTLEALSAYPQARVIACEPNEHTRKMLHNNLTAAHVQNQVTVRSEALSDKNGTSFLYDFAADAPLKATQPTSTLATLYPQVMSDLYGQPATKTKVSTITLDELAVQLKLTKIDFLKLDVEGHELAVLQGATKLLAANRIQLIQFEFNELHAYSRVFVRDFVELLGSNFELYRLLPDGPVLLPPYRPVTHEIFAFQNLVAIHR